MRKEVLPDQHIVKHWFIGPSNNQHSVQTCHEDDVSCDFVILSILQLQSTVHVQSVGLIGI